MPRIDDQKSPLGATPKSQTGPVAPQAPKLPPSPAMPQDATALQVRDKVHGIDLSDLVQKVKAAAGGAEPPKPAPKSAPKPAPEQEKKGFFASLWGKVTSTVSSAVSPVTDFVSGLWKTISGKAGEVGTELYHDAGHLALGISFEDFKTRAIEDDPSDVNHYTRDDEVKAERETRVNLEAEKAALAKLSPEDRREYKTLLSQVEGHTMARRQMQAMLLSGELTDSKALIGGATLLHELHFMTGQPLAEGIDRKDLVAQVIGEVENPVRIAQHSQNTCGATTAQILLVRKNPAEYVRLVAGLAAPGGHVPTAGGSTLKRKEDWNYDGDGDRSISSRLFQPAVMQLGQMIPGMSYSNTDDKNVVVDKPIFAGMFGIQQAKVDTELTGQDYDNHLFMAWNRDSMWEDLKRIVATGKEPVPVSMSWNGGGHFVQIDKIEGGKVHFTNPWGERDTIDEAEFKSHISEYQAVDD